MAAPGRIHGLADLKQEHESSTGPGAETRVINKLVHHLQTKSKSLFKEDREKEGDSKEKKSDSDNPMLAALFAVGGYEKHGDNIENVWQGIAGEKRQEAEVRLAKERVGIRDGTRRQFKTLGDKVDEEGKNCTSVDFRVLAGAGNSMVAPGSAAPSAPLSAEAKRNARLAALDRRHAT